MQILVWKLGDSFFGADIKYCIETQKGIESMRVPFAPEHIDGIANLRGEVIVIYNLMKMLKRNSDFSVKSDIILRFKSGDESISVTADSIEEVIVADEKDMQSASAYFPPEECKYILKILENEIGLVQIINIDALFEG